MQELATRLTKKMVTSLLKLLKNTSQGCLAQKKVNRILMSMSFLLYDYIQGTNFFILGEGEYNFRIKIQLVKQWVGIGINIENIEMKKLL